MGSAGRKSRDLCSDSRANEAEELAMFFGMTPFTFVHVVLSLLGIASGFVIVYGLLTAKRLEGWTGLFLASNVATSVTGFFLPSERFLPSHAIGIIALVVLTVAIIAWYGRHLVGRWRTAYVVSSVIALYLNVFILIAQLFLKVPVLNALAPTQSEPPFLLSQAVVLALFIVFGIAAVIRFGNEGRVATWQPRLFRAALRAWK
jgi:hypothetical protein